MLRLLVDELLFQSVIMNLWFFFVSFPAFVVDWYVEVNSLRACSFLENPDSEVESSFTV